MQVRVPTSQVQEKSLRPALSYPCKICSNFCDNHLRTCSQIHRLIRGTGGAVGEKWVHRTPEEERWSRSGTEYYPV